MEVDEEVPRERRIFTAFEKHDEFVAAQDELLRSCEELSPDDREQRELLRKLSFILDSYQEQAYLLDQYLEKLVNPAVECLKRLVKDEKANGYSIGHVGSLLYTYVKFRGYKSITRFFPHEIADLSIALDFLARPEGPAQHPWHWALRYIMLLWLSLICMLPFDLAQFDEPETLGKTARDLEDVAKSHLGKAGVEREGAAIMLARLYARKDMSDKLGGFLEWTTQILQNPSDPIPCIGALHVLSELAKTGSPSQIQANLPALFRLVNGADELEVFARTTLLRKYRAKLSSRVLLRLLPARSSRRQARALATPASDTSADTDEDEFEVPDETEDVLQDLFKGLQDRDTIVRYSSAKAVARIAERLPHGFAEQVLDQVLQLFTIHSMSAASLYDMPCIAEGTWHGACLACAEMARRSLIPNGRLGELLEWMRKALYFDIRRGANSVGASVRDAASYVLWSIARAQNADALAPHAITLAQTLVTVAVFDREVHIRRAASAAFQEFVGRTSLFPCGIDVLRKTDFYAVGTRRHAFLGAAVEVAAHTEYRHALLEHLITVTLRHWDPAMRQLGAQSLRGICGLNLKDLGLQSAERVAQYLTFPDSSDIHGALLALSQLALAFQAKVDGADAARHEIYLYLVRVPDKMLLSTRHELLTAAACELIAHSISRSDIDATPGPSKAPWRSIVDFALRSPSAIVQEAVANAMVSISKLVDCSGHVARYVHSRRSGTPPMQQNVCRVLGVLDYNAHPHGIASAMDFLLGSVDRSSPSMLKNVEARRNAYDAMPQILTNVISGLTQQLPSATVQRMLNALLAGLEDYTMDERGDVGSWIRVACVKGLASMTETLITHASTIPDFAQYLPASTYHELVGGILKQGVERLDNVRQQAGEQILRLLELPLPQVSGADAWQIHRGPLMKDLFLSGPEIVGWNDGSWLFPKVVQLLEIAQYRRPLLAGLVLSASCKTDSTQRPVSIALVSYARSIPVKSTTGGYDLCSLAGDLLTQARANLASNSVVVPVLQCFNFLLEGDAFEQFADSPDGLPSLDALLNIASRNITRVKNVQRIEMSMRVTVNLLGFPELRERCITHLLSFLTHQYPKIRADTAEYLYLILQSKDLGRDTDEAEDVLLETEWSSSDVANTQEAAQRCVGLLSDSEGT